MASPFGAYAPECVATGLAGDAGSLTMLLSNDRLRDDPQRENGVSDHEHDQREVPSTGGRHGRIPLDRDVMCCHDGDDNLKQVEVRGRKTDSILQSCVFES
jgi:hypothetical protein